jgi:tetratricopeptide (TPR) repeat protein/serine/threonine protein kinase
MSADFQEVKGIFLTALEKASPLERAAYLDVACGSDLELRQRVETLIKASEQSAAFLDQPAAAMSETQAYRPISERAGSVIGPYKLLEQIGEGGFGVVFMAEQLQPVRRKVALKVLKPGMDTRQVVARFEAERQALAIMDHPNIARVFDGGMTETGRPYFVMELVRGETITEYCDRNHLPPRERLELFVTVCQAVQHAHQKGIIHRDLKPSNVLVTVHDTAPVVKVIDFGVAKAMGQELTDRTLFTAFAQMIGTPLYMSPEQAGQSGLDIDTRSDIYSLGVLLYELLTGTTPFDRQRFKQAAYDEIRRIIREEEPPKPSTRLSGTEELPSVAANRGLDPKKLSSLVRGELDWIVMKALEKDRNRRYETANSFAIDVQRYLADEPVQACPPSAGYWLRKFARRNRAVLLTSSLVAVALLIAMSGVGWAIRDRSARQSRVEAQAEVILESTDRLMKDQNWDEARAAARRAEDLLAGSESHGTVQNRLADVLKDVGFVERLEQIRNYSATIVSSRIDDAGTVRRYEKAFREFGVDVTSMPAGSAAAALRERAAIVQPMTAALDTWIECRRRWLGTIDAQCQVLADLAQQLDSDPVRNRLRASLGQAVTPETHNEVRQFAESLDARSQPPATLRAVTMTLRRAGLDHVAEGFLRRAQSAHPGDFWLNFELAHLMTDLEKFEDAVRFGSIALGIQPTNSAAQNNLGVALEHHGKVDEALGCYLRAVELDPKDALVRDNLGVVFRAQGRLDEAAEQFRAATERDPHYVSAHMNLSGVLLSQNNVEAAIAVDRGAVAANPNHALLHYNLGVALIAGNQRTEAIASYREAIRLDPNLARAHNNLGLALRHENKLDEAVTHIRRAIELEPNYALAYCSLGSVRMQQGDLDDAMVQYRRALELDGACLSAHGGLGTALARLRQFHEAIVSFQKVLSLDPTSAWAHQQIGHALRALGELTEAARSYQSAVDLDPANASNHSNLATALRELKSHDQAEAAQRRAISLDPKLAGAHYNLGLILADKQRFDEALIAYREAVRLDPALAKAHTNLGIALAKLGKQREAIDAYRTALRHEPNLDEAQFNLAWILLMAESPDLREPGEGLHLARGAIATNPKDSDWWFTFALAHYRTGDTPTAAVALRRRRELLQDDDAVQLLLLAMVDWQMNRKDEARRHYDRARPLLQNDTSDATVRDLLRTEAERLLGIGKEGAME